jgi:hypothetical protein
MPEHRSMAEAVAHELQMLEGEKQRLEQLLDLDENWRALRDLEAETSTGGPTAERAGRRAALVAVLAANRIYAARQRLVEAIELLAGNVPAPAGPAASTNATAPLPDEVVTLDQPDGSRVKVRVKARRRAATADTPAPAHGGDGLFGNGGDAVSVTVPGKGAPSAQADTLMSRLRRISEAPPLQAPAPRPPPGVTGSAARSAEPARSPREDASDQAAHAAGAVGYNGEIEEATVVIIHRDPALGSRSVERSAARPPKAPLPGRRRGGSSKRKGGGPGKKPTGRSKPT